MNHPQYPIIVLPTAFEDLDAILEYIKRDSPQNAARVIERLWKAVQSLTTLPHRHKIYRWNK